MNVPGVDDGIAIERNKGILEIRGIDNSHYGLLLSPLLFFRLFGTSVFALRLSQVFFLFLALFLFSKLRLSPKKKIIGLFLIATSPFIIPGRNEANFLPLFVLLPFVLLDKERVDSKKIFLASLILGFGSAMKLTVLYFAVPLLVFSAIFKKFEKKQILCLILGLILGFSPFLITEVVSNFPTIEYGKEILLNGKTSNSYEIFNLFPNFVLVLSYFRSSFNLIPHDLGASTYFYQQPVINLSSLLLISIYFSLFLLSSFILIIKRQRLELVLTCLTFILLLQFSPSIPKAIHFYFLFPFVIFLVLEWMNEKNLLFLIIPIIASVLLTYSIVKNLPNEEYFPQFAKYNHELLNFLKNLNSSILITPLSSIDGFQPFLNFKEIIVPIKPIFEKWEMYEVDEERLSKDIDLLIEKNESLTFVFPSYERNSLKERSIYRTCYSVNSTDYSRTYPCYDATEAIKEKVKNIGKLEPIRTINDSNGIPVYEIFNLVLKD